MATAWRTALTYLPITRRRFSLAAAAAWAGLQAPALRAQTPARPYMADMHSHYGMFLPRLFGFELLIINGAIVFVGLLVTSIGLTKRG